jgi:mannose-6-phosphate isomerase-like protein (cupin superfamily)
MSVERYSIRPWGMFEVIDAGEGYLVKRLTINPGGRTSLQRHKGREEDWVVAQGRGTVTYESMFTNNELREQILHVNHPDYFNTFYIGKGEWHRIHNTGEEPLVIIEIWKGVLDEDDIERKEDDYGRVQALQGDQ